MSLQIITDHHLLLTFRIHVHYFLVFLNDALLPWRLVLNQDLYVFPFPGLSAFSGPWFLHLTLFCLLFLFAFIYSGPLALFAWYSKHSHELRPHLLRAPRHPYPCAGILVIWCVKVYLGTLKPTSEFRLPDIPCLPLPGQEIGEYFHRLLHLRLVLPGLL